MKKVLLFLSITLLTITAYSQTPVDTADLRAKINDWIVPNSNRQITASKVNQLFNGIANLMKAYAVDSAYRINDTLFFARKNGFQTIKVTLAKDSNFANSDLVFNADHTHDGNHHSLHLDNFGHLELKANTIDGLNRNKISLDSSNGVSIESPDIDIIADVDGGIILGAQSSEGKNTSFGVYGGALSFNAYNNNMSSASGTITSEATTFDAHSPYVVDSSFHNRSKVFHEGVQQYVSLLNMDNGFGQSIEYRRNEHDMFKDTTNDFIERKHKITGALIKRTDFGQGLSGFTFNASGSANPNLLFYVKSLPTSGDSTTYKPAGISSTGQLVRMNNWSGAGGMSMGSSVSGGTSGSILYLNSSGNLAQDNPNFFWDQTNKRFGRRTTTPAASIHIHNNDTEDSYLSFTTPGNFGGDPVDVKYTIKPITGYYGGDPVARAGLQFKSESTFGGDPLTGTFSFDGIVGIGTTTPTAKLHLPAGEAYANYGAPLKFTSGTLLTTPENGAVEYDGTSYYLTTGGTRHTIPFDVTNAITKTGNLFKLGGALTQATTISSSNAAYNLSISGVNTGSDAPLLNVSTTSNGNAIKAYSSNGTSIFATGINNNWGVYGESRASDGFSWGAGTGVYGVSGTGIGVSASANSTGTGLYATSGSGLAIDAISSLKAMSVRLDNPTAPASGTHTVASFGKTTSGFPVSGAGFGMAVDYQLAVSAGTARTAGQDVFKWSDATDASRSAAYELNLVNNGTIARKFQVAADGTFTLDRYTSAVSGTAVYNLGVDATGKVITTATSGGETLQGVITANPALTSANTITAGSNAQTFTSTAASGAGYSFQNTGNGNALSVSTTGSSPALSITNTGDGALAATFKANTSATFNAVTSDVFEFRRGLTGGTASNGIGGNLTFRLPTDAGNEFAYSMIQWSAQSVANGARSGKLSFSNWNNGTVTEGLVINSTGQLKLTQYGSNFDVTDTTTYKPIVVDNVGNVKKMAGWPSPSVPTKVKFVQTATTNVTANDDETTLIGTGVGSLTIPANTMTAGKSYRLTVRGKYGTDNSNPSQMNWRMYLGSTVIAASGNAGLGTNKIDEGYQITADITCHTAGSSGSVMAQGMFFTEDGPGAKNIPNTLTTINTTVNQTFNFTVDLTDSSAGNNCYVYILTFEEI